MEQLDMLSDATVRAQITRYEHFIDVVLRGDLQRITSQHEKLCERVVEYMNIKSTIKTLKDNNVDSFKSMSDIGSNCYVKCVVPKTDMIFLDIGLNCVVELKLDEAATFIEKRIEIFNQTMESLVSNSSKIKAHIKLILNLIDQLKSQSE